METDKEIVDRLVPTIATKTARAIRLLGESQGHLSAVAERLPDCDFWEEEDGLKESICGAAKALAAMVLFKDDMDETPQETSDD